MTPLQRARPGSARSRVARPHRWRQRPSYCSWVIFHNALDIAEILRQLLEEGWTIEPEDLARISPYLTEHIKRFGEYSTYELGIQPEAYDPKLDVDFTPLREQDPTAAGFGQAA
ncbi:MULTISPECIES: transposase [unclassified Streptomyces]|uniref:transposase n=1 Tax=Streptomyces TaxID=1883 RepID=UPI0020C10CEA|nr:MULTISPECIES: transposase [unclassified Streptomyces]MCL6289174.1 transposase [Streptomyces sp. 43Y-GA-1]MDX3339006.1 Tn3 family transposase [Streptomyces sp. ME02-6979.5a]